MLPRLCFAPFFALLLAASGPARAALPEPVVRLLGAAGIPDEAVAILVLRGETTVLAHQELRAMAPASTMKLLTTMAALERLGPAFRGRTELRTDGRVVGSELRGDLILRGGADPDFSSAALEQMLIKLRGAGIRTVKGRLVIDRSLFQPTRADLDAAPFDATPEARYNVIPDALLLNANLHNIQLRSSGHTLALAIWPQQAGVTVGSDMTLIDADCTRWEDGWLRPTVTRAKAGKLSVMLHGTFPRNCTVSYQVNVLDRQDYVERELRQLWRRMGGVLTGTTVEGVTPADTLLLAEHVARALPEVIRDVNKVSDNALARTLFLSLGSLEGDVQTGSRPLAPAPVSTAARADQAVRRWMSDQGIDANALVLDNGSGLSRTERISARELALVLHAGARSVWAPEFISSLPIGALDGSMRSRLKDSVAASRARLKTGALKDVAAIAGYVPDANGQHCIVVAMINHPAVAGGAGRAVLDALVDWVAHSDAD